MMIASELKQETLDRLPVLAWLADKDGRRIFFNKAWGFADAQVGEVAERNWISRIHPNDLARVFRDWRSAWRASVDFTCHYRFKVGEQEYKWLQEKAAPCFDDSGLLQGYHGICQEMAIEGSWLDDVVLGEQQARIAFDQLLHFVGLLDTDGTLLDANRSALEFSGISADNVIGRFFWDTPWWAHDKDLQNKVRKAVAEAAKGNASRFEVTHPDSENQIRTVDFSLRPVFGKQGEVKWLIPEGNDITELTRQRQKYEEILVALDSAKDSIFVFDAETLRVVYANRRGIEQTQYPTDELHELTLADLQTDLTLQQLQQRLCVLNTHADESLTYRTSLLTKNNNKIPVEISIRHIPNLGSGGRYVAVARDITEQLRFETSLEDAKKKAERSEVAKSDFLANMSHEIRTPMGAILGFTELLDEWAQHSGVSDPNAIDAIKTIRRNSEHLLSLINDILDVSKMDAGKLTLDLCGVSPRELVIEVFDLLIKSANEKQLDLQLDISTCVPTKISTDPLRLKQILFNLLGNAIKFTDRGFVRLEIFAENNLLRFRVIDTGIGLSPAQLDHIQKFEPFSQADTSTTRKFGGTGLGLRISNALIALLGGKLELESCFGRGSVFTFGINAELENSWVEDASERRVPHAQNSLAGNRTKPNQLISNLDKQRNTQQVENSGPLNGKRILVAEDGIDNQRLVALFLKKAGAEFDIVCNGLVAVETVEASLHQFDAVLMDVQMPIMGGHEATAKLREIGFNAPIIALTAHALQGDREKCMDAGCNAYLTKPINRQILIDTLAELIASDQHCTV